MAIRVLLIGGVRDEELLRTRLQHLADGSQGPRTQSQLGGSEAVKVGVTHSEFTRLDESALEDLS